MAYGDSGYPFSESKVSYDKGICPTCEILHEERLISHELMRPFMTKKDLDDVIAAFQKVARHLEDLK